MTNAQPVDLLPDAPSITAYAVETIEDSLRIIGAEVLRSAPETRQLSAQLLNRRTADGSAWEIRELDHMAEVGRLYDWVAANVRYTADVAGFDTFQRALRTVELGIGDCDDLTILMGAMAMGVGFPVRLRVTDSSGEWDHIYPLIGVPGDDPREWIAADLASGHELGWEQSRLSVRRRLTVELTPDGLAPVGGVQGVVDSVPIWAWLAAAFAVLKALKVV